MKNIELQDRSRAACAVSLVAFALLAAGCAGKKDEAAGFETPEAAVAALVAALEKDDTAAAREAARSRDRRAAVLGRPRGRQGRPRGVPRRLQGEALARADGDKMTLTVGDERLADADPAREARRQVGLGRRGRRRRDDLPARRRERARRHRRVYGFVNAQNEYASEGRDGDPAGIYALKLISDEGLHNGLYWPTAEGETPSPAGPFVAAAAAEGYAARRRRARRTTATTTACCTRRARMPTAARASTSRTAC